VVYETDREVENGGHLGETPARVISNKEKTMAAGDVAGRTGGRRERAGEPFAADDLEDGHPARISIGSGTRRAAPSPERPRSLL
jgi:hypothetical protein